MNLYTKRVNVCVLKKEGELFGSFFHLLHLRYREPYNRASMTSDARYARLSRRRDSDSG